MVTLIVGITYTTADGRKAKCTSYESGSRAMCKVEGHDDEVLYTRDGKYLDTGAHMGRERLWQIVS